MLLKKVEKNDDSIQEVSEYVEKQGHQIQAIIDDYIMIIKHLTQEGIKAGDTYEALMAYIVKTETLSNIVEQTLLMIRDIVWNYAEEIDTQERVEYFKC